jgi:predicted DNA-binding protein
MKVNGELRMPKKSAMKKSVTSVYLEPEQADSLRRLSEATRITQANYIREAIDDLLKKYAKELRKRTS